MVNVSYHASGKPAEGWDIEFAGTEFTGKPVDRLDADESKITFKGQISVVPLTMGGVAGAVAVSRVTMISGTGGTFDLSFKYGTVTKTVSDIDYDVTADELEQMLNAAVSPTYKGISVEVDRDSGGFKITFGGSTFKNLSLIHI